MSGDGYTCPKHLFKYRSFSDSTTGLYYLKRVFTHQEVYFAKRSQFNDPFDKINPLLLTGSEDQIRSQLKQMASFLNLPIDPEYWDNLSGTELDVLKEKQTPAIESMEDQMGIFCTSECPDDLLMWAHYANSHMGICLQFASKLLNQSFELDRGIMVRAERVKYKAEYPEIKIDRGRVELDKLYGASFCWKSENWDYEKEWRYVDYRYYSGKSRPRKYRNGSLTGVIMGAKIDPRHREFVEEWISQMEFQPIIYDAVIRERTFSLVIPALVTS